MKVSLKELHKSLRKSETRHDSIVSKFRELEEEMSGYRSELYSSWYDLLMFISALNEKHGSDKIHDREKPFLCKVSHLTERDKQEFKDISKWIDINVTGETKIAKGILPCPEKLRLIADWFDSEQGSGPVWVGLEIQADLRRWADNIEVVLKDEKQGVDHDRTGATHKQKRHGQVCHRVG